MIDLNQMPLRKKWAFPEKAFYNKIVAKEKILKQTPAPPAVKKKFRDQIEKVRCTYELTSDRLNLEHSPEVPKILVLQLTARVPEPDLQVMEAMDRAFGVPVFFEIIHGPRIRCAASYRQRRAMAGHGDWVYSRFLFGEKFDINGPAQALPVVLSLNRLYEVLIRSLVPLVPGTGESLGCLVARWEEVCALEQEAAKLGGRIKKERQFNRKVELNRSLNQLKDRMEKISRYRKSVRSV